MKFIARTVLAALLLGPVAGGATESTGAAPVIEMTDVDFDVASTSYLHDAAKTYVTDRTREFKEGKILAFVVVASPNLIWDYRGSYPSSPIASVEELAREALEGCEFYNFVPCRIVNINGKSTRRPDGSFAQQPAMINFAPTAFDFRRIPFVAEQDRVIARGYRDAPSPKAFYINSSGGWNWKNADTEVNALTEGRKACEGDPVVTPCMLYAVNNTVVLEQPK